MIHDEHEGPNPRPRAGSAWSPRKLEEAREDQPHKPSEGARSNPRLSFGLLASRTMRQCISVVLSHQVHGNSLQQPQEPDTELLLLMLLYRHEYELPLPEGLSFLLDCERLECQGHALRV